MYNEMLARKILEHLEQVFPQKMHLHELQSALPEYRGESAQGWLFAIEALRLEGKIDGKFLRDGFALQDAALLHITEKGRQYLKQIREPQQINQSKTGLRIFLCHSSKDKEEVRDLYNKLNSSGFRPWLDENELLPGQDWESEIRKAVRASHVVIVCLSTSSITKEGYVQKEIRLALDAADEKPPGTIFLIPARINDCQVPDRLRGLQWVDLFVDGGFHRLLTALRSRERQLQLGSAGAEQSTTQADSTLRIGSALSVADKPKADDEAAREVAPPPARPSNGKKTSSIAGPLIGAVATIVAAGIGAYAVLHKPSPIELPLEINASPFFIDFTPRASGGPRHGTACSEFREILFPGGPYDAKVNEVFVFRYDAAPICVGQGFRSFNGIISWAGDHITRMVNDGNNNQFPGIAGSLKVSFSKIGDFNVLADISLECVDVGLPATACTAHGATVVHIHN